LLCASPVARPETLSLPRLRISIARDGPRSQVHRRNHHGGGHLSSSIVLAVLAVLAAASASLSREALPLHQRHLRVWGQCPCLIEIDLISAGDNWQQNASTRVR
jgi:hypothetical protein